MLGAECTLIYYRTSLFQGSTQRHWKITNIAIKTESEKVSADNVEVL